jgi:rubrerythrin
MVKVKPNKNRISPNANMAESNMNNIPKNSKVIPYPQRKKKQPWEKKMRMRTSTNINTTIRAAFQKTTNSMDFYFLLLDVPELATPFRS